MTAAARALPCNHSSALRQQHGHKLALTVAHGTKLRVQAALRATDTAGNIPFFSRLAAVRCTFRCLASIISLSGVSLLPASSAKMRLNTPSRLVIQCLVRPVFPGCILPLQTIPDDVDDPADHPFDTVLKSQLTKMNWATERCEY